MCHKRQKHYRINYKNARRIGGRETKAEGKINEMEQRNNH